MNKIVCEKLNEKYYSIDHKSGLKILLYPMEGYSSAYALFGTKYGSIDSVFKTGDEENFTTVPDGIAHFLEHKLFENEEGDAFSLFAKTGASANAFTSFDKTCYLFSCADNFEQSLKTLLQFVREPYFTKETIEKEQGIIGQEIRMYDDNPGWRVFFGILGCLYKNNPVKKDIAGTTESIAEIDKDILYKCYNTFYNLGNMVLSIAGNFDPEKVLEIADEVLTPDKEITIQRAEDNEPEEIANKECSIKLEVAQPIFNIGYKMQAQSGKEGLKAQTECEILIDMLTGDASSWYNEMYEKGLINSTFSGDVLRGRGFFSVLFEGESKDPKAVYNSLQALIDNAKSKPLSQKDFEIAKKSLYGKTVRSFNNVESVASGMINAHFSGVSIYDNIDVIASVTLEDVENRLKQFDNSYSAISTVFPG